MPKFAIYENQIMLPEEIYQRGISPTSHFTCFNCDEPVLLRQSRGKSENYVEHFYHPNPCRNGTHIECENVHIEKLRKMSDCHTMFSKSINTKNGEIFRFGKNTKHFVDGYDFENELGIEFQNSPISPSEFISGLVLNKKLSLSPFPFPQYFSSFLVFLYFNKKEYNDPFIHSL